MSVPYVTLTPEEYAEMEAWLATLPWWERLLRIAQLGRIHECNCPTHGLDRTYNCPKCWALLRAATWVSGGPL